jgi:hypothetical protein
MWRIKSGSMVILHMKIQLDFAWFPERLPFNVRDKKVLGHSGSESPSAFTQHLKMKHIPSGVFLLNLVKTERFTLSSPTTKEINMKLELVPYCFFRWVAVLSRLSSQWGYTTIPYCIKVDEAAKPSNSKNRCDRQLPPGDIEPDTYEDCGQKSGDYRLCAIPSSGAHGHQA